MPVRLFLHGTIHLSLARFYVCDFEKFSFNNSIVAKKLQSVLNHAKINIFKRNSVCKKTCKILILCNLRECCTPKQEIFLGIGKELKWPQEWFNLKFHLGNKWFSGGWWGRGYTTRTVTAYFLKPFYLV